MGEVILAIGAHPDDFELGCGGTLLKHCLAGDKVYGLVLSRGENGNHSPSMSEAMAAANHFGLRDIKFMEFPDGQLSDTIEYVSALEARIREIGPSRVYTHTPYDRHQDHRTCSKLAQSSARFVPQVLLFESPSTTAEFAPTFFSDITNTISGKVGTLKEYQSQVDKGVIDLEFVFAQALYWGFRSKAKNGHRVFAEAFEVARYILS